MQAIEGAGGIVAALEAGLVAEAVGEARDARAAAYADGTLGLIGVTRFQNAHDERPAMEPAPREAGAGRVMRFEGADSTCPALAPVRWAEAFEPNSWAEEAA
jgi:methylmalonyl-CoA mutase